MLDYFIILRKRLITRAHLQKPLPSINLVWFYLILLNSQKLIISDPSHRVFKSHRSKMVAIYMQSWKQCVLSVITNNSFEATHAFGHMMYSCTLLVPINQRELNELGKQRNISSHVFPKEEDEDWEYFYVTKIWFCITEVYLNQHHGEQ